MTYRIQFVRSAAKAYSRLDAVLQRRVDRELHRLGETPRHAGVIRLQSADELYRVRIGNLRLLFSGEDQILLVLITRRGKPIAELVARRPVRNLLPQLQALRQSLPPQPSSGVDTVRALREDATG